MKQIFSLIFSVIFCLSTSAFAELLPAPSPPVYATTPLPSQEHINKNTSSSLLRENKNIVIAVVGTLITVTVGLLASNADKGKCTPPKQCAAPN